jgi:hypothetical protein
MVALGETPADSSFGLVFLQEQLDVHSVVALRQAERMCDVCVAVNLHANTAHDPKILEKAGVSYFLHMQPEEKPKVTVSSQVGGLNLTFILQAVLAVMPSAMVVPVTQVGLLRGLNNLLATFENLFVLMPSQTPHNMLATSQAKARSSVLNVLEVDTARSLIEESLQNNNEGDVISCIVLDGQSFEEKPSLSSRNDYVRYILNQNGQLVIDACRLNQD